MPSGAILSRPPALRFTTGGGGGFVTITDSFTAANGTPNAGRTTDTGGKVWAATVGTLQIQSNQLAPLSTVAGDMSSIDAGVSDFTYSIAWSAVPAATAMHFRLSDASNFWKVTWDGTELDLSSVAAGVSTIRAGVVLTVNAGDTLAAVCSGSSISVKQNGVQVIAPITNAFNSTATMLGALLRSANASARWDSLSVTVP